MCRNQSSLLLFFALAADRVSPDPIDITMVTGGSVGCINQSHFLIKNKGNNSTFYVNQGP